MKPATWSLLLMIGGLGCSPSAPPENGILAMHLDNIQRAESVPLYPKTTEWPSAFTPLSMTLAKPIRNIGDHKALIRSIPESFFSGFKLGKSVKYGDWFMTPLGSADNDGGDPNWIMLLATKKGGQTVFASSVW